MIVFPSTAHVGRTLPKEAFYRQLELSHELKEKFVSDVRRIVVEYALTADSIHVDKSDELQEILILTIQLKKQEFDPKIVEAIARQNKHKLVFVLTYEEQEQLAIYSGRLYRTPWLHTDQVKLLLQGHTVSEIWDGFVEQIALADEAPAVAEMTIVERLLRQERMAKLQRDIDRLERTTRREIQPRKKFDMYQRLQTLKKELEEIKNG